MSTTAPQLATTPIQQPLQNTRQNELPMKRIDGSLVMRHEYVAGAPVELMQIRQTASSADSVLPHPPEPFTGIEVVPTMGREEMAAQRVVVVLKGRVELVGAMDPAAIDDHHDLCAGGAESRHHLMAIRAQLLGIKVGHDCIEDFRGAILHRTDDAEPHPAGDPAPGAIRQPRLAVQRLLTCDLTLTQRTCREARALGCAPPARTGQGKTPQDRVVFIEQHELAPACAVCQCSEVDRARGEVGRVGSESASRAAVGQRIFFRTPRTLSRPSGMPVARAKTVASARPLHWD
jgi:hypothetical protein